LTTGKTTFSLQPLQSQSLLLDELEPLSELPELLLSQLLEAGLSALKARVPDRA